MTSLPLLLATSGTNGGGIAAAIGGMLFFFLWIALILFFIIGMWKVFSKAGQPGWAAIIPIFNVYVLCKIGGRPGWWLILFFIPIVNLVISAIVSIDVAKSFGRSALFGIGLWLLGFIFYPILGFGSAEYVGPSAA